MRPIGEPVKTNMRALNEVNVQGISAKKRKQPRELSLTGLFLDKSGNTYSRTCSTTIGSKSLTTVFGMGTGVTFWIWSPERTGGELSPNRRTGCVFLSDFIVSAPHALERSIHVAKHSSVSTG